MYKWLRMYIKQVMILLQFERATRLSLWSLNVVALEKRCILFFLFKRLDNAQNIQEYIARMQDLEVRSPTLWQLYEEGHIFLLYFYYIFLLQ